MWIERYQHHAPPSGYERSTTPLPSGKSPDPRGLADRTGVGAGDCYDRTRLVDAKRLDLARRRAEMRVEPDGRMLMLDVLLAEGALEAVWQTRARIAFAGDHASEHALCVVSRAGLITLKLAAGRPHDLVDIRRLEEVARGEHDAVLARLRAMSELSSREPSPMPRGVDMSPRAVAARLRDIAELCELCRKLGTGRVS